MGLDLNKPNVALVTESGEAAKKLDIEFSWQEPTEGGIKGLFGPKTVNVDASTIYYEGGEAFGYVSPKNKKALGGAMIHGGDVKKGKGEGSGERITINLADIRDVDSDIDAFALVASCAKGNFDNVAEAVCRIFVNGEHRGNVRVPIQGSHTGVVIGTVKKTADGWSFTKADKVRGPAREWRELADLAAGELTR